MRSTKAGYIGARPNYSILTDFSCNAPPVHTYGSIAVAASVAAIGSAKSGQRHPASYVSTGNRPVRALESGRTTGNYPNYLDTCLEDQEFIQSINQYKFRDSIFVFKPLRINSDAR